MTENSCAAGNRAAAHVTAVAALICAALLVLLLAASPARAASASAAVYPGVAYEKTVVKDRFGDGLLAYLEFPADAHGQRVPSRFPVILHYTYFPALSWERSTGPLVQQGWTDEGYNLAQGFDRLVRHGYVVAQIAPPGTGGSQGPFTFNTTGNMALAGYDAVQWLAQQPWSTGKVGMFGGSGNGIAQLMTAATHPPNLVTIIPAVAFDDLYDDVLYKGGVPALGDGAVIQALAFGIYGWDGLQVPTEPGALSFMIQTELKRLSPLQVPHCYLCDWYAHPTKSSFWDAYTYDPRQITIPMWAWGNWDDFFTLGTFDEFERAGTADRMLAVGFDGHSMGPDFDPIAQAARWFDFWLKGDTTTGIGQERSQAPVQYYEEQANAWRTASSWPPADTSTQTLYLRSGRPVPLAAGGLQPSPPATAGHAGYVYTPASVDLSPQNGLLGAGLDPLLPRAPNSASDETLAAYNNPTGHMDQRLNAAVSVTYVSAPLTHAVDIAGSPISELYAKSTASDTYWIVKLIDVFPNSSRAPQAGYWNFVDYGQLEGTHRNGNVEPQPIPAGQVVNYHVGLQPISYQFAAGHRIAVQIASSDIRDLPNLHVALNTVEYGPSTPTQITLPLVSPGPAPAWGDNGGAASASVGANFGAVEQTLTGTVAQLGSLLTSP